MRLLLIEDDLELSQILKADLQARGFAVDVAADGIEGEYLGREEVYDVVILDLGLPGRSGLDLLKNWRAAGIHLPVLVLTARDEWFQRVDGFRAGADDYLGKPFHFEELIARITALLHRTNQRPAGRLTAASLTLDEERQEVITRTGEAIPLTGTEFRMLRYFILHPQRVISKATLMEHIYDFDSDKESNVIEAYIRRLRQKLGKDVIKTRRGQGYVLQDLG